MSSSSNTALFPSDTALSLNEKISIIQTSIVSTNGINAKINTLFNRISCMPIMIEGEVDDIGNLLFATGTGSFINNSFGIPLPHVCKISSWTCVSSAEINDNIDSMFIPINLYNNSGTLQSNSYTMEIKRDPVTKLFNNFRYSQSTILPVNYDPTLTNYYDQYLPVIISSFGNILSVGTPTITVNDPTGVCLLSTSVRFRILIEILIT